MASAAGKQQTNKDKEMASHLKASGYPHGRRSSKGLSNIPNMKDVGSAAYRRRTNRGKEVW